LRYAEGITDKHRHIKVPGFPLKTQITMLAFLMHLLRFDPVGLATKQIARPATRTAGLHRCLTDWQVFGLIEVRMVNYFFIYIHYVTPVFRTIYKDTKF